MNESVTICPGDVTKDVDYESYWKRLGECIGNNRNIKWLIVKDDWRSLRSVSSGAFLQGVNFYRSTLEWSSGDSQCKSDYDGNNPLLILNPQQWLQFLKDRDQYDVTLQETLFQEQELKRNQMAKQNADRERKMREKKKANEDKQQSQQQPNSTYARENTMKGSLGGVGNVRNRSWNMEETMEDIIKEVMAHPKKNEQAEKRHKGLKRVGTDTGKTGYFTLLSSPTFCPTCFYLLLLRE